MLIFLHWIFLITLNLVDIDKIVISDRFEHSGKVFKKDNIIRPLCIILPQRSGYIKDFDNDRKNMSFKIKNNNVLVNYNENWNKILKNAKHKIS